MKTKNNFRKLWGKPLLIAVITIVGLVLALVGDDLWDVLSWLLLLVPVLTIIYYLSRKREEFKV